MFPVFTLSLSSFLPVYSCLSRPYTIPAVRKGGMPVAESWRSRLADLAIVYVTNIAVILLFQGAGG